MENIQRTYFHYIRPEWEEDVRCRIQNYIFYWSEQKNTRQGFCTRCGREMIALREDQYPEWRDFFKAKHNSEGRCPVCGNAVMFRAMGKLRNPGTLDHAVRMLFVDVFSPEKVWVRGFYINVKYRSYTEQPEFDFSEVVRYELTPGHAEMWARKYSHLCGRSEWTRRKSIGEPWPLSNMGNLIEYDIGNLAPLEGTFLRYIPFEEFFEREYPVKPNRSYDYWTYTNRIPWGRILSCAARYTFAVEMAVKHEMFDLLDDLICRNNKHACHINWNAKNPRQFLRGISKKDFKAILYAAQDSDILNIMDHHKYLGLSVEDIQEYARYFDCGCVRELGTQLEDDPVEIMKYLLKQRYHNSGIDTLRDYRQAAETLGRDLTVPTIRWPKNLKAAHDEFTKAAEVLQKEIAHAEYVEGRYRRYRRLYEYVEDEFMVIVPERLSDIKLEGELQHHCVGGYIERHADGTTVILFVRRTLLPLSPLYTAELTPDGKLRQIQGYHNEAEYKPTPEADAFVKRWLAEVQRRLAKDKKRKKKEEAA